MENDEQWLNQWRALFMDMDVLELGCGRGRDTEQLVGLAKSVVAGDIGTELAVVPGATIMKLDHSKPLMFKDGVFDVVLASLSLHYFTWCKTHKIVAEISRVLRNNGKLLCRLNSTQDYHFGANSGAAIESGLYEFEGTQKRFFSDIDINALFESGWSILYLQHSVIDRYSLPKRVWTVLVEEQS